MSARPLLPVIHLSLWFALGIYPSWVGLGLSDVAADARPSRWNSEIGICVYVIGCVFFFLVFGALFGGWMYYRSRSSCSRNADDWNCVLDADTNVRAVCAPHEGVTTTPPANNALAVLALPSPVIFRRARSAILLELGAFLPI
jgi:hypothetical protein